MLASKAEGAKKGGQDLFGGMDTVVLRNGYGGQVRHSHLLLPLMNQYQANSRLQLICRLSVRI
jgi:glutamine amidotransferase PdxT